MPGPKKTPTKILKKRGSWRAGSRGGEPVPDPAIPKKPEWVTDKAALYWYRAVKLLNNMGVLAAIDGVALGMYCDFLDLYVRERAKGGVRSNSDLIKFADQIHKGEKAFGLTPADRAGLVVEKKPVDEGKAKYFRPKIANG